MTGMVKYKISAGAIVLFSLLFFFDDTGAVSAMVPAVALHELGHLAAMRYYGARVKSFSLSSFGLEIDYSGLISNKHTAVSLFAGPLFGGIWAVAAMLIATPFFSLSGAISLMLTVFNLLPVLPLDGGRLISCFFGEDKAKKISRIAAIVMLALGFLAIIAFRFPSLLMISAWIFVYNYRST